MSGGELDAASLALARLHEYAELTDLLEDVDGVDDGAAVIEHGPVEVDAETPVAVGVRIIPGATAVRNTLRERNHVVQTDVQIRESVAKTHGEAWRLEINDAINDVLAGEQDERGWKSRGGSGGVDRPPWSEETNRYRSVRRFDIAHLG